MVLHQHEAAKFGTEMAIDPIRQRRQDGAPVRRDPTLALVTDRTGGNDEILYQKRLMTLEARSFGDRDFHHMVFNAYPRRHLASEMPLLPLGRLRRFSSLVHAARFDIGA